MLTIINNKGYEDFLTIGKKYEVVKSSKNTIYIISDNKIEIGVDKFRFYEFQKRVS